MGDDGVSSDARLEMLTAELARVSADQSGFVTLVVGFVGSALLTGGGFIALSQKSDAGSLPDDWLWGFVLLIPLLMAAYTVVQTGKSVVRQYYARSLEREILDLTDPHWRSVTDFPVSALFDSLNASYEGNNRADRSVRLTSAILYVSSTAILLWAMIYSLTHIRDWRVRTLFVVLDALVGLPAGVSGAHAFFRGRALWSRVRDRTAAELRQPLEASTVEARRRSLGGYLLMPRPNDFVVKAVFLHLVATIFGAILLWLHERDRFDLGRAVRAGLALIVGFEYLVYQARYMLNDWRGRTQDEQHFQSHERRRAPGLTSPVRCRIFIAGAIGRALIGVGVPFALLEWRRALGVTALSCVAYLLAVLYELLRSRTALPTAASSRELIRESIPVYLVVGVSYGLRAAAGLWFGSDGRISAVAVVATGVAFYAVGVMSVLMAWALEGATGTAWTSGDGRGSEVHIDRGLHDKAHVVGLGMLVRSSDRSSRLLVVDPIVRRDNQKFLKSDGRFSAPWNVAAIAAIALTAGAGAEFFRWPAPPGPPVLVGVIVGAACGLAVVRAGVWAAVASALPPLGGVALLYRYGWPALLGLAPPVLALATYTTIRSLEYRHTQAFWLKPYEDLTRWWRALAGLIHELRT